MNELKFKATIQITGVNPYVLVSEEQARHLQKDWRKPMPVLVQVNGKPDQPWRINMMPAGDGNFYLYLHGDVRKASETSVGDRVTINVSFDSEYQGGPMHPIPDWFEKPLSKNPQVKRAWDNLTPSRQKEVLRYFAGLKSDKARQRNLIRALDALSVDNTRFMGRTWKGGK